MGIRQLIADLEERVREELTTPVHIEEATEFTDLDGLGLYVDKRAWKRIDDVVVVVADLKGSTKLNFRKHANTSARLYEALVSSGVRIMNRFQPAFVDIQGDGMFALFHGARRYERGLCAGITLKTFSAEVLVPEVAGNLGDRFPDTGLKVGMHAGMLVAKKVGIRGTNEPVWAGKPVNWAFKAAQKADAHQLVVTRKVFQKFEDNDYVTYSCGCVNGNPGDDYSMLWKPFAVETLPDTDADCMVLRSTWCAHHGDAFCDAVLAGETKRQEVSGLEG